ncbi:uncharacterized protein L201_000186 [Kwoniella dendrophila CBS 6074]|uniref:Uncharacterized protein n=1 Tax=Kwoniella dendrophila CBS 6074 TaxID=1295534 RepID=A0AAX4JKB9_9TREE
MAEFQFVLYLIKDSKEAEFRQAFEKHARSPRMVITFHPATMAPAKLGADINTDSLIVVKSNYQLTPNQIDKLFESVQNASKDLGGSMCPVRDQTGQRVDPEQSKWAKFKRKMHMSSK